jgi:hypothetical protein
MGGEITPTRAVEPSSILSRSKPPHEQSPPPSPAKAPSTSLDTVRRLSQTEGPATYGATVAGDNNHQSGGQSGFELMFPKADTSFDLEMLQCALTLLNLRYKKTQSGLRARADKISTGHSRSDEQVKLDNPTLGTRELSERFGGFQPIITDLQGRLRAKKKERTARDEGKNPGVSATESNQNP